MHRTLAIASLLAVAGAAQGQSLNLDVSVFGTPGWGEPGNTFGAAGGQGGFWQAVASSCGACQLRDLNADLTPVTFQATGQWINSGSSQGGANTDYSTLMFDYAYASGINNSVGMRLNNLSEGTYRVIVYTNMPGSSGQYNDGFGTWYYRTPVALSVNNVVQALGSAGGAMTVNQFAEGVTHYSGVVHIPAGGFLTITGGTDANAPIPHGAINGVQLVKYGTRIYVDASATGAKTGVSWANAFTDLQQALAVASTSQGGITEIWVANGVYTPTSGTDRTKTFTIPSGIKLYGGFEGGETGLNQRTMATTYLSGNIGDREDDDNSYHVVTVPNGASTSTIIDGFTIVGGNANGGGTNGQGGGMYIGQLAGPIVRNCDFYFNFGVYGGAVYSHLSYGRMSNCNFSTNGSDAGGAIHVQGSTTGFIPPFFTAHNCDFTDNFSATAGGAVNVVAGDAYFFGCVFNQNSAATHGGAIYGVGPNDGVNVTLDNCTIVDNTCDLNGGAIYASTEAEIDVRNSIVWDNRSTSGSCIGACEQASWAGTGAIVRFDTGILQSAAVFATDVNCIDVAPGFVDSNPAGGYTDLRLSPASPAIDRGSNAFIADDWCDVDADNNTAEDLPLDIAGQTRQVDIAGVTDTGTGPGPVIDLGAYEAQQGPCAADLSGSSDPNEPAYGNPDGTVDSADFFYYLDQFVANNLAEADLTGSSDPNDPAYGIPDGIVDASDFFFYLDLFVQGCP